MQASFFPYVLLGALAIGLLVASVTDWRRRQIDNWLNAAIALAAPLYWLASGMDLAAIGWQLALAAVTFAVLCGLFALRQMGGGDVKLLTALALWFEPMMFLNLLFVMAIVGALLTLAIAAWHVTRRRKGRVWVPYGIAIACAGLWTISCQLMPALQTSA